jgi:hypothetical protein
MDTADIHINANAKKKERKTGRNEDGVQERKRMKETNSET